MNIEFTNHHITSLDCDTIIIPVMEEEQKLTGQVAEIDKIMDGMLSTVLCKQRGCQKFGAIETLYAKQELPWSQVILIGLGKENELTADRSKAWSGIAARAARDKRSQKVTLLLLPLFTVEAVTIGFLLGNYCFLHYKTDKNDYNSIDKLILVDGKRDRIQAMEEIKQGRNIADGINLARTLVNHPSNVVTPHYLAQEARRIANRSGLELTVLDRKDMVQLKMNALLAVAKGSHEDPKLIVLKYTGAQQSSCWIAFVGKGITFDSGGISLKPGDNMHEMKDDMGGAAAVLGAISAIARLKLAVNILAVLPCTENMPSGTALKPGDVITSMEGKTIEVVNTDAEGRLILADGLTYARHLGATHLVDVATLTGACVRALGHVASGVITNHEDWGETVLQAARDSGEKMWKLPSFDEYNEQIKSTIADLKNTGGHPAGAITAGLFLANFTGGIPWVHIDIAGTVTTDKDKGYQVKGATGAGAATLIELAIRVAE